MKKFAFSPFFFFHLLVVLVINRLDNYLSIFIHPLLDNFCKIYVDDSRFVMVGIAEILKLAKYKQPFCRPDSTTTIFPIRWETGSEATTPVRDRPCQNRTRLGWSTRTAFLAWRRWLNSLEGPMLFQNGEEDRPLGLSLPPFFFFRATFSRGRIPPLRKNRRASLSTLSKHEARIFETI